MTRKTLPYQKIINVLLILIALGYLLYRLLTFNDYPTFFAHFQSCSLADYCLLVIAFLLFPLNIAIEAFRWQYLLRDVEPISFREANRQVYYGCVGAFITPNRLGEYPTRALLLKDQSHYLQAITLGFVGSFAMLCIIEVIGITAVVYFFLHYVQNSTSQVIIFTCYLILVLALFLILFFFPRIYAFCATRFHGKALQILEATAHLGYKRFFILCLQTLLRYLIFSFQLYCFLYFCGVPLSFLQAIIAIPSYYSLVSIMPSIPVADTIFRGSWALIVFSFFTPNTPNIATAVLLIWIINTVIPMLIGMVTSR